MNNNILHYLHWSIVSNSLNIQLSVSCDVTPVCVTSLSIDII